jgi:uncharacterized protein YycO
MTIQLDPGAGGHSIDVRALQMADIIVSTTKSMISARIRGATSSPVSHSILYIGDELVVEAIGDGVVLRTLAQALEDATLAVVYRYPEISDVEAREVRDFVGWQLGKKYNYAGIGQQALHKYDKYCIIRGPILCRALEPSGDGSRVDVTKYDRFTCSQLVFSAFRSAGIPLTSTEPSWSQPGDIPFLQSYRVLEYVGHLKA